MSRRHGIGPLGLGLLLLIGGAATAAPGPGKPALAATAPGKPAQAATAPGKPAEQAARPGSEDLFRRGLAHQRVGELDQAILDYEQAYARSPQPTYLFQLGEAHREARHPKEAVAAYRRYLKALPDAADRQGVQEQIDQLERESSPPRETAPVVLHPAVPPLAEALPAPPDTLLRRGGGATTEAATPLYRNPWLWTAVGVVLVAGGVGVGLGVGLRPRQPSFQSAPGAIQ